MKKFLLVAMAAGSILLWGCDDFTISQDPGDYINPDQNEASLTFVSPQNDAKNVQGTTPVTFLWNKPIFTLQNPEVTQRFLESAVTITPKIKGSWQVLGTTGILFEPQEEWKNSTRYEFSVPLNIEAYGFETPRVKLERNASHELIAKKPVTAFFNQEILLEEAQKCAMKTGETNIAYTVEYRTYTEMKDEEEVAKVDKTAIVFTPQADWIGDVSVVLTIPEGFQGTDGPLPTEKEQTQQFRTISAFKINNFNKPNDVFANINVSFSTNVSKQKFYDNMTIEPVDKEVFAKYVQNKKETLEEREKGSYFWLEPFGDHWMANQEYTITISGELIDQYGRKLGEDQVYTFNTKFPNRVQGVFFPRDLRAYRRGEFPKFSLWYSGEIQDPWVKVEQLWPEYKEFAKKLDWESSTEKRTVVEFDMTEEFPGFFEETDVSTGIFRVTMSHLSNWNQNYRDKLTSEFVMVDFPVEMKEDAREMITLLPVAFPGEALTLDENISLQFLGSEWSEGGQKYSRIEGVAKDELEFKKPQNMAFAVVQLGDQIGIASDQFQNGISPWDSPVSFDQWSYKNKLTATAFPDRPLFRPGDTMFFKSIIRERELFQKAFPLKNVDPEKELNYRIVIQDPRYQEVYQEKFSTQGGSFDGSWDIPEDAMLGQYHAQIEFPEYKEGRGVSFNFYVTEYRKPDFLIDAEFNTETAIWQDEITAGVGAEYAFGGALAGREVDYRLSLFGHEDTYWYWEHEKKMDKLVSQGKAMLNDEGKLIIPIDLNFEKDEKITWDLLNLNVTVHVSAREKSSKTISIPFRYSADKVELDRLPYFFGNDDEVIEFSGKVMDLKDKPLAKKVTAVLLRRKWVRNDRKDARGDYVGEWHWVEESIEDQILKSNDRGEVEGVFVRPEASGEYILRVISKDDKGREAVGDQFFYVWTSTRDDYAIRQNETNKILPLYLDKDDYLVGEKVDVLFPHTEWEIARAHVTIERGTVLEELTPDLETQQASFEVESWMAPNVIVSVLIEGVDDEGKPQVRWGAINVPIKDPSRILDIEIIPEKEQFKPGETAVLKIRTRVENESVPAEVTISVVDQTLLALRSRPDLNLWQKFLAELPLGVKTTHTLANFLSEKDLEEIYDKVDGIRAAAESAFGGGGGGKGEGFKPRGDFRDTAAFIATIQTDEKGEANVEIKLPDNLTKWHVWGVGHTNENAFGESEAELTVTLPVLITPIVPNFFRVGDETEMGVLIRRNIASPEAEEVTVTLSLPAEFGEQEYETKVSVGEEERVFFPVSIPYDRDELLLEEKEITFIITVETAESEMKDAFKLKRKIIPPVLSTTAAEFLDIKEAQSLSLKTDERSLKSTLSLKVFGTLMDRLQKFVDEAKKMNYGCSEQRMTYWTSRILQETLFAKVGRPYIEINEEEQEENMEYILKSQAENGGFHFWSTQKYWRTPSPWLTTHILEFAPEWEGVEFPEEKLLKARNWLRGEARRPCEKTKNEYTCHISDSVRQNAAYVLLRDGEMKPEQLDFFTGYLRSLESKVWFLRATDLFDEEDLSPKTEDAIKDIEEEIDQFMNARDRYIFWSEDKNYWSFFSQDERLTAMILDRWVTKDIHPEFQGKVARYLTDTKSHLSGNTALRVLLALRNFENEIPEDNFPAFFEILTTEGGEDEKSFKGTLDEPLSNIKSTIRLEEGEDYEVSFSSPNEKSFYADIELHEIFPARELQPINKGFWIERDFYELNDKQFETPITDLTIGENYVARIKIVAHSPHRQVVIEDTIPSGAEGVNLDLENEDQRLKEFAQNKNSSQRCWGWCRPQVSHQEFYFDKAWFFVDHLAAGTHEFKYIIRARLAGKYEQVPAKVLEMYYPEVMATSRGKEIVIGE